MSTIQNLSFQLAQIQRYKSIIIIIIICVMSVAASSKKVIKYRLKNGQCIHCGIQTHDIIKKGMLTKEKVALNIPGIVENGRCLNASCQQAGHQVAQVVDNGKSPFSLASLAAAAGPMITLGGVILSAMGVGDICGGDGAENSLMQMEQWQQWSDQVAQQQQEDFAMILEQQAQLQQETMQNIIGTF